MASRVALDDDGKPLFDQFSKAGCFGVFRIAAIKSGPKNHTFRLTGSYQGADVGFGAVVRRGARGVFGADMKLIKAHIYRPAVKFIRTGAESDTMVAALHEIYRMPEQRARMADITPFVGIALQLDEGDIEAQTIRFKLLAHDREVLPDDHDFHESSPLQARSVAGEGLLLSSRPHPRDIEGVRLGQRCARLPASKGRGLLLATAR